MLLFTEANSDIIDGMEDLGLLPSGNHLYRKSNGAGGHTYYTDECGIMAQVWDTCIAHRSTLIAALLAEEHFIHLEQISNSQKKRSDDLMEIERAAATGGSFLNPIPTDRVG